MQAQLEQQYSQFQQQQQQQQQMMRTPLPPGAERRTHFEYHRSGQPPPSAPMAPTHGPGTYPSPTPYPPHPHHQLSQPPQQPPLPPGSRDVPIHHQGQLLYRQQPQLRRSPAAPQAGGGFQWAEVEPLQDEPGTARVPTQQQTLSPRDPRFRQPPQPHQQQGSRNGTPTGRPSYANGEINTW
eukprot:TRINITY_DN25846_c0_g1_i1.p1 TRINITY_DN25846_c0_g1~~TRINITY_DN25846_c0_g1_i1.p1  ORF type:complete len:182 (-),score=26.09 TRINITY_DN25846_c0_g1_i1:152-697(-)